MATHILTKAERRKIIEGAKHASCNAIREAIREAKKNPVTLTEAWSNVTQCDYLVAKAKAAPKPAWNTHEGVQAREELKQLKANGMEARNNYMTAKQQNANMIKQLEELLKNTGCEKP